MSDTAEQEMAAARAATRERLRARFEAWLDEALVAEPEPPGVAAEMLEALESEEREGAPQDLYALWEAVTALTQEVRLQGRAFQQLEQGVAPLVDRQEAVLRAHEDALGEARRVAERALAARTEREREVAREAAVAARAEALAALLEVRDRLGRAGAEAGPLLEQARGGLERPRLLGLVRPHPSAARTLEAAEALQEGCRLALGRLDELLERLGVRGMDCLGRPFDPTRMEAVRVVERPDVEDGTVVEVHRPGYESGGTVARTARVAVARRRA